jgi:hypothetical protein
VTFDELMATLGELGVMLRAEGDALRWCAPAGTLTPELRTAVAEHKATVLAAVVAEAAYVDAERRAIRAADGLPET